MSRLLYFGSLINSLVPVVVVLVVSHATPLAAQTWAFTYAATTNQFARMVLPTVDRGYIVAANTNLAGDGDLMTAWILKLNP